MSLVKFIPKWHFYFNRGNWKPQKDERVVGGQTVEVMCGVEALFRALNDHQQEAASHTVILSEFLPSGYQNQTGSLGT